MSVMLVEFVIHESVPFTVLRFLSRIIESCNYFEEITIYSVSFHHCQGNLVHAISSFFLTAVRLFARLKQLRSAAFLKFSSENISADDILPSRRRGPVTQKRTHKPM